MYALNYVKFKKQKQKYLNIVEKFTDQPVIEPGTFCLLVGCFTKWAIKGHLSWSFYFLYVLGIFKSQNINYILVSISSEL